MGTKRTPRGYAARMRMTPAAAVMFKRMERLSVACTCPEIDWEGEYSKSRECPACNAWAALRAELHRELKLPPWVPTYEHPDAEIHTRQEAWPRSTGWRTAPSIPRHLKGTCSCANWRRRRAHEPYGRDAWAERSPTRCYYGSACAVPVEKRDVFLQRIGAMLTLRGRGHFGDSDVQEVAALALRGLIHNDAA